MPSLNHLQNLFGREERTDVFSFPGHLSQRTKHIRLGYTPGHSLEILRPLHGTAAEFPVKRALSLLPLTLRKQKGFLEFLKLFGDIALRRDQGLPAHIFRRHRNAPGAAHFEIVSEDLVGTDFESTYSRTLPFPGQIFLEPGLALVLGPPAAVQLLVETRSDNFSGLPGGGEIPLESSGKKFSQFQKLRRTGKKAFERRVFSELYQGGKNAQGMPQGSEIPRSSHPQRETPQSPLHILALREKSPRLLGKGGIIHHEGHPVLTLQNPFVIPKGAENPLPESAPSHGVFTSVEHGKESFSLSVEKLQVLPGGSVEIEEGFGLIGANAADVRGKRELGFFEIAQSPGGTSQGEISPGKPESLQGGHTERLGQIGLSPARVELSFIPRNQSFCKMGLQRSPQSLLFRSGTEDISGLEGAKQPQGFPMRKHSRLEISRTGNEKGEGHEIPPGSKGSQAPIRTTVRRGIGSGSHHPDNLTIHQFFPLGLFHLIADGHPISRLHQTTQIVFRRMEGNSRHGNFLLRIPGGEGNVKYPGSRFRIVEEHLEEISHAEKEKTLGIAFLPITVLLQHGSHFDILGNNPHRILLSQAKALAPVLSGSIFAHFMPLRRNFKNPGRPGSFAE
jgi:hypothetical protein